MCAPVHVVALLCTHILNFYSLSTGSSLCRNLLDEYEVFIFAGAQDFFCKIKRGAEKSHRLTVRVHPHPVNTGLHQQDPSRLPLPTAGSGASVQYLLPFPSVRLRSSPGSRLIHCRLCNSQRWKSKATQVAGIRILSFLQESVTEFSWRQNPS